MQNKENFQSKLFHFDLYGKREDKYDFLNSNSIDTIEWNRLAAEEPNFFFVKKDFTGSEEYEMGIKIDNMFGENSSGIKTHDDSKLVSFAAFHESNYRYHYRVFDERYICYDLSRVVRHRYKIMKNLIDNKLNISLISTRQNSTFDYQHIFVSKLLVDINSVSLQTKEISYVFPLYLYPDSNGQSSIEGSEHRTPNLNPEIVNKIAEGLNLTFTPEKEISDSQDSQSLVAERSRSFAPIDILDYIYAVLHSPSYREKYKEFLKIDFPRVPYPNPDTFWQLVKLGGELRQLHLMESPLLSSLITKYPIDGTNTVDKIEYKGGNVWINDTQYFESVPEISWSFYIGGYQPAQKWLKDRKGRTLNFDDILHYQRIVVALKETDRLMKEIDGVMIEM